MKITMVYSALRALYWFLTSGCEKVQPAVRTTRFDACLNCDKLQCSMRCEICGCWVRIKTWLPRESCPIEKWVNTK